MPRELGNLKQLSRLALRNNDLTGYVPQSLWPMLAEAGELDLAETAVSGCRTVPCFRRCASYLGPALDMGFEDDVCTAEGCGHWDGCGQVCITPAERENLHEVLVPYWPPTAQPTPAPKIFLTPIVRTILLLSLNVF